MTETRAFATANNNERRAHKPKPWTHQQQLANLKGEKISLILRGDMPSVEVLLLDADQFTIKVQVLGAVGGPSLPVAQQSVMTYFKSALVGFGKF